MADNVEITAGTGTTVAADLVDGVLYQRVKITAGADGTAVDVSAAAPLPVLLTAGTAGIGKLTANSGVDIGDVDITSIAAGTNVIGKVTIDQTTPGTTNKVSIGTDGTVVLGSGTAGIGKLTANTGVDIGDVDITSIAAGDNNIGNVDIASIAAGDNNIGNVDVATIAAGENLIGLVGASDTCITVTATLDTSAYSSGDLLFDSTEIAAAVRANGGHCVLQSITITDIDDQKTAHTLVFLNAATDMGAANSAPDPDDTELLTIIGHVPVVAADWVDMGTGSVACIRNIGLGLKAGASTTSLWVAGINGTGTPTHSASGLKISLYLMRA